ncbi:AbiH family protein [Pedobacter frigoris]|uniref:AbiH family protein n=1 Tax=Pedobacter frigoris TaxID=2571272 RepID=UPI00292CB58B|nr:AbiH family protein [Pedobacter frigoris]
MNRLIIIGNGFDLAHGLKTSYCDFITAYIVDVLTKVYHENSYEDPLIKVIHNGAKFLHPLSPAFDSTKVFQELEALSKNRSYEFEFKSALLENTVYAAKDLKWVDLENDYFDALKDCRFPESRVFDLIKVRKLNQQFQFLKNRLEGYLQSAQYQEGTFRKDPEIEKIFKSEIQKEDLLLDKTGGGRRPQFTMFLNFNYTNTVSKYLGMSRVILPATQDTIERKDALNYIHGQLGADKNPIIFGFGDEYDSTYQEFELARNNEVFHHIKSFAYLKTRNYHDLIRFLMRDKFQVFIVGHSCGLSDRTMFREIFGHENCRSIKIFYYQRADGTNDFTEKTFDIARHFIEKGEMRKKIVPEPLSSPLPQYNTKHLVVK